MLRILPYKDLSAAILCVISVWLIRPVAAQEQESVPQAPIYQLQIETASAVAWSPDGKILAIGDTTGIRLYTETLDFIELLEQPTDELKSMAWSPDGQYLAASGVHDGWHQSDVYVWDYATREPITIFSRHEFMVPMLAWSPDSKQIASASWDKTVQVWDIMTGEIFHTLTIQDKHYSTEVFSVSWSPMGNRIATVVGLKLVIWDADTGEIIQSLEGPKHPYPPNYHVISLSPDGHYLASHFTVIDVMTGEEINSFETCYGSSFMAWHPNSQIIATLSRDHLYICNVTTDEIIMVVDGGVGEWREEIILGYLNALDWHPDGKRLASVSFDGTVRIWQVFENE